MCAVNPPSPTHFQHPSNSECHVHRRENQSTKGHPECKEFRQSTCCQINSSKEHSFSQGPTEIGKKQRITKNNDVLVKLHKWSEKLGRPGPTKDTAFVCGTTCTAARASRLPARYACKRTAGHLDRRKTKKTPKHIKPQQLTKSQENERKRM